MSMKRLVVLAALVVALGTVLAAPAFAQHDPNAYDRGRASDPQRPSTVPSGDIYYGRNGNANPDFQLGGSRWKTLHRAHPASHSVKHKK
jgi:hypothetical protein